MTISYPADFLKALFRWKGSAWKSVWKDLLIWLCLYYAIRITLDFALVDEETKTRARKIIELFFKFTSKVPLEFLLGFYVVQVVTRWWTQIHTVPWPDEAMAWINALFPGLDRESKLRRHTIARYMILCETLAFRSISSRIRKRFPKPEQLVSAGLMLEEELKLYKECPCRNTRWQLPLNWAIHSVILPATGMEEGKIPLVVTGAFINQLNDFRSKLRELFMYDWICIPLVYTQTVSVVVYGYFALCLVGHQFYGMDTDIYVPVLAILQFFFFVGWFKVAQDLMRPFGEDDDDLELNCILDRHAAVAFNLADHVCNSNPPLVEGGLFKNANKGGDPPLVRLPYSAASLKAGRDRPPKLQAMVEVKSNEQIEMAYKNTEQGAQASGTAEDGAGPLRRCKNWLKSVTAPDQCSRKEYVHF